MITKIKGKHFLWGVLSLGMCVCFVILLMNSNLREHWFGKFQDEDGDTLDVLNSKHEKELAELVKAIKKVEETNPEKAREMEKSFFSSLPETLKRKYQIGFESGIEKFGFYGKVIDQYDEPVEGVVIPFEVGGYFLASGSGRASVRSDVNGRFFFRAKGGNLRVGPLSHKEIADFRYRDSQGNIRDDAVGFFGHQRTKNGDDLLWTDYNETNPYVFRVWRIEQTAGRLYSNRLNFGFTCDETIHTINFSKPLRDLVQTGDVEGQLKVSYACDAEAWRVEIMAVDGGVADTQDVYLNEAPENGYNPSLVVEQRKNDEDYKDSVKKSFYFVSNDGSFYGGVVATIRPYIYGRPTIIMDYKVNPEGGRSLVEK